MLGIFKHIKYAFCAIFVFCAVALSSNFAFAGYVCPAQTVTYSSCNTGYYMTYKGVYNGTPQAGNLCSACPDGYTCSGGTAAPTITCAAGTRVVTAGAKCTTPSGGWWTPASHTVTYGQVSTVNYCMAGWTNTYTAAGYHRSGAYCRKSVAAGNRTINTISARYIKVTTGGNTLNEYSHVVEIQAFASNDGTGTNLLSGKGGISGTNLTNATDGSWNKTNYASGEMIWDMGSTKSIGSIKFALYTDGRTYSDVTIAVSTNNSTWTTVLGPIDIATQNVTTATGELVRLKSVLPCTAGTYSSSASTVGLTGSKLCAACAIGSYASGTGNTGCTACQNGTTTTATGQSSCNAACSNATGVTEFYPDVVWNTDNTLTRLCDNYQYCDEGYYISRDGVWADDSDESIIDDEGWFLAGTVCSTCPDDAAHCPGGVNSPVYPVTFNFQGGTADFSTMYTSQDSTCSFHLQYSYTAPVCITKLDIPTRTGYTFKGYYTAASGGTQVASADGTMLAAINTAVPKNAPSTLYAQWTVNTSAMQADLYFRCEDGSYAKKADGGNAIFTSGYSCTDLEQSFICAGKYVTGWDDDLENAGGLTNSEICDFVTYAIDTYGADIGINFTAKSYGDGVTSTVTLNKNGGTGGTSSVNATYGSAMPSATMPMRPGYMFSGYYDTNEETGGTSYYTSSGASARNWDKTSATTLYARWTLCPSGAYCPGTADNNSTASCPKDTANRTPILTPAGSDSATDCYVTCPSTITVANAKTVTVVDETPNYNGSAYPACAYNVTCNDGYSATNNGTANPSCSANTIKCDAGTYLEGDTATCNDCPQGYGCPGGTFEYDGSDHGLEECSDADQYQNLTKQTSCKTVDVGYYKYSNIEQKACTNKPSNASYTTSGTSATTCSWQCNANYYKSGNACTACSTVSYTDSATDTETIAGGTRTRTKTRTCYHAISSAGSTAASACYGVSNCGAYTYGTWVATCSSAQGYTASADGTTCNNVYKLTLDSKYYSSATATGVAVTTNASPTVIYEKYGDTYYTDAAATTAFTKLTTMPKYNKYIFGGFWMDKTYDDADKQIIDSSGNLNVAKQMSFKADATLYVKYIPCTCTKGSNVDTCTVTGTNDNNQCTYSYTCANGYHTSGEFTGAVSTASNKSPDCAPNTYKVTLDKQGGTGGTSEYYYQYKTKGTCYYYTTSALTTCTGGTSGDTITIPTRDGYTFAGYFTGTNGTGTQYVNASGGTINNLYNAVAANTTLYAKWTECGKGYWCSGGVKTACTTYGANYTTDGTTSTKSSDCYQPCTRACTQQTCPTNSDTCAHGTTTTSGIQYYGSSCNAAASTCSMTFTCKAGYEKNSAGTACTACTYTVKYNANGGSGTMSNSTHTYDVAKTLTANTFTRAGYTFAGWATSTSGSVVHTDKKSVSKLTTTCGGTVNLYAVWSKCASGSYCTGDNTSKTCPTAYPNSAAGSDAITDCYSNSRSRPISCTQKACSNPDTTGCSGYTCASSCTCSGSACSYTVYSNAAGTGDGTHRDGCTSNNVTCTKAVASLTANANRYVNGTTSCPACPTAYPNSDGGNKNSTYCYTSCGTGYSGRNYNGATDTCAANKYTITLNKNHNDAVAGTTALYTTYATGVYTDSARTKSMTTSANGITAPTRSYTVTYDANGGSVSTSSSTSNYTFNGYYSATSGGTQYTGSTYILAAGLTAGKGYTSNANWYAQWTGKAITLSTPTRTGYTFNGWYTAATGGTKIGAAGASYTPTANIKLYAQWTANTYTVTYSCGDADTGATAPSSATATYNSDFTPATNTCTKRGYDFAGWIVSNTSTPDVKSAKFKWTYLENKTFTAKWTVKQIECDPGYYLSSNSLTCSKCDAGNACPGGTYPFSVTGKQGITQCSANTYATAGAASCSACTALAGGLYPNSAAGSTSANACYTNSLSGVYVATGAASSTTKCPAGTAKGSHTVKYGSTSSCTECAVGKYSAEGASSCSTCPNSGTTASTGATAITQCYKTGLAYSASNGSGTQTCYYTSGSGTSAVYNSSCTSKKITSCVAGYYLKNSTDTDCSGVSSGYYSAAGQTTRDTCPTGYNAGSSTAAAITDCKIDCPAATYLKTAKDSTCTPADTGYWATGGVVAYGSTSTQTQCPANYRAGPGASAEQYCQTECAASTYVATAKSACTTVGGGYWSAKHNVYYGSTSTDSRNQCPENYRAGAATTSEGSCITSCADGTAVKTAKAACVAVGSGYYMESHTVFYGNKSGTIGTCPTDTAGRTVKSASGADAKTDCYVSCGAKTISDGTANVVSPTIYYNGSSYLACTYNTSCNPGFYGADGVTNPSCTACAAGKYSAANATTCTDCAAGSYSAAGASACTACAAGTTSAKGSSSCSACSNKANVSAWDTPSWTANTTSNVCSVKTCAAGYSESNNACVACTYTVKYNANGGSGTMSSSTHTYDVAKTLTANTFTRAGYTFAGWATSTSGTVVHTDKKSVSKLTTTCGGTVNLYAVWSKCASGSYCPGDNTSKTCPTAYPNSAAGSDNENDCYLTTTPGNYVKTQGAGQVECEEKGYCAGGTKVWYSTGNGSATGGRTACPTAYPNSAAGSDNINDCYLTTSAGNYVKTQGAGQVTCVGGNYCAGGTKVWYSTGNGSVTGGSTACPELYPNSADGASHNYECYLTTTPGNYVAEAAEGETPCEYGSYCPGGIVIYYNTGKGDHLGGSAKCAVGSYASGTGNSACTVCGNGKTTASAGSSSASACIACSNNTGVSAWETASWTYSGVSSNSVKNLCMIDTCSAGYTLASNACGINTYSITYYDGSSKLSLSPSSYKVTSSDITLPTPYKAGKKFVSWHTDSALTSTAVTKIAKGSTGNKEFYVKWTDCPAGYACNGSSITQCTGNTYAGAGASSCTSCPAATGWEITSAFLEQNGITDANGTSTGTMANRVRIKETEMIHLNAGTYTVTFKNTSAGVVMRGFYTYSTPDDTSSFITMKSGSTLTLTEDAYVRMVFQKSNASTAITPAEVVSAGATLNKTSAYVISGTATTDHDNVNDCKISCPSGSYVAVAGGVCVPVASGKYVAAKTVAYGSTNSASSCPATNSGSDSGRATNKTCYYTCPSKTVSNGTATVVSSKVYYTGSAYPTCTYTVKCNTGYSASGSGTATPSCTACPYTVTYNSNKPSNASGTISGSTANSSHTYDTAKALTTNGYKLTGWTFQNWNTAADGSGTTYTDGQSVQNLTTACNGTVTLYAQWKANTYTVTYNSNKPSTATATISGSTANSSHTYDTAKALTANGYKLTGYTFKGWSTSNTATSATYADKESVKNLTATNSATVTLYAVWAANCIPVTFNMNYTDSLNPPQTATLWKKADATGWYIDNACSASYSATANSSIILSGDVYFYDADSKEPYVFRGFYDKAHSDATNNTTIAVQYFMTDGVVSTAGANLTINSPITVYAAWATPCQAPSNGTCNLAVDTDGDTHYSATCKDGYTLSGYDTYNPSCTANTYTVAFNSNKPSGASASISGTMSNQARTYDDNVALTANAFKLTGWTFQNWNTAADGSGTKYTNKQVANLTTTNGATVTLYAQWKANTYTVTFNTNGATSGSASVSSVTCTYDSACSAASQGSMLKTNSVFKGWGTSGSATSATYSSGGSIKNISTGSAVTLYAVWGTCTACSAGTGATCSMSVTNNTCTYTTACKTGYNTLTNSGKYNPSCTANTYTVAYDANGGSGTTASSSHTYDVSKALTANGYTLSGHVFSKWNTAADGSGTAYADKASVKNLTATNGATVTLYAQWTRVSCTATNATCGTVTVTNNVPSVTITCDEGYSKTGTTDRTHSFTVTGSAGATSLSGSCSAQCNVVAIDPNGGVSGSITTLYKKTGSGTWYTNNTCTTSYSTTKNVLPTRSGYTLRGLYDTKYADVDSDNNVGQRLIALSGNSGTLGNAWKITEDTSLYAAWAKNCVTPNNGTCSLTIKDYGYTDYTTTCNNGYSISGNNTATPSCTGNKITLMFANGGHGTAPTSPASCTYGSTFTMPSAMSATGYTFNKWSVNGNTFGAGQTNVTCNYTNLGVYSGTATITGTWNLIEYTITYNLNGGTNSSSNPSSYTIETATITLANPTKNGYTFAGWYDASTGGNKVTQIAKGSTGNKTLYARWNNCGAGYWCANGGKTACPSGLTTIGYGAGANEAGDCGRVLYVGGQKLYLRSTEKTDVSLHVKVGGTTFYGNMVVGSKKMSAGATKTLKIKHKGQIYSVYDDSAN